MTSPRAEPADSASSHLSNHPFVVLKFGGTSVSSAANWQNIATVVKARIRDGFRPMVVHSALSGITDRLEQLLALADDGQGEWQEAMDQIEKKHRDLAAALQIVPSEDLEEQFRRLRQI